MYVICATEPVHLKPKGFGFMAQLQNTHTITHAQLATLGTDQIHHHLFTEWVEYVINNKEFQGFCCRNLLLTKTKL